MLGILNWIHVGCPELVQWWRGDVGKGLDDEYGGIFYCCGLSSQAIQSTYGVLGAGITASC